MSPSRLPLIAVLCLAIGASTALAAEPPVDAIDRLRTGNETFVANASAALPVTTAQRLEVVKGQHPFAIVLSCADSRVPPEVIFHTGLGELFVVRVAGSAVDKSVLASMEYAAEHLHVPALVVMGHDSCGAVKAAIEAKPGSPSLGPNLDYLIKHIRPAFARAPGGEAAALRDVIVANVEEVVNQILADSEILAHLHGSGKLALVGAYYELESGRVRFSQPVPPPAATASQAASPTSHDRHSQL